MRKSASPLNALVDKEKGGHTAPLVVRSDRRTSYPKPKAVAKRAEWPAPQLKSGRCGFIVRWTSVFCVHYWIVPGKRASAGNEQRVCDYRTLSLRQHGVVTRAQLLEGGMSSSAIGRKVAAGELVRIRPRIFLVGGCPLSWEARLTAASLACDPPAAISHRSAAAVWGFETFDPGPVEVTTVRPLRDVGGVAHRSKILLPAQVTHYRGFFLTTPSQTLIDLGAVTSAARVAAALDSALLRGLTSLAYLSKHLERFGGRGRPGTGLLRRLIEERQEGCRTESELERLFSRNVIRPGSLPRPIFQYLIFDGDEFVARRDFVYPFEMVAIEVDGWRFHAGLEAWQRDLATDNRLIAMGWVVLRFTWDDVANRPDQVIRRIREVLEQRGQARLHLGAHKGQ